MNSVAPLAEAASILIVDDDADLREQIAAYLSDNGFIVNVAANAAAMDRVLGANPVDIVVLDVMMPGEGGLSICRRLRDANGPAVVMLSAMGEDVDRIVGLELGADDYLSKPCNPRELLARIRVLLRRREDGRAERVPGQLTYRFAGFTLGMSRRQLKAPNGVIVMLTGGEFTLLSAFLQRPNQVLTRDELLEYAHGAETEVYDRAIDVQISRLRRKLHAWADGELIVTLRGVGYMLRAEVAAV
jgi:two-component system OmpR family response regulator